MEARPRYRTRPTGESWAPALEDKPIDQFPAAREHAGLLTCIDWAWVQAAIDAGRCVAVAVTVEDVHALIDTVYCRIGADVVTRWEDSGVLYVARPWNLEDLNTFERVEE